MHHKKLEKKVDEYDRLYSKALIKMKCSEFDIPLLTVYEANESLFDDKSLLEKLYEPYG